MCNEAARRTSLGLMREDFNQLKIRLRFPEGLPNLGEAPSVRITDTTVIVRAAAPDPGGDRGGARDGGGEHDWDAEMVQRRWSWVGPGSGAAAGKPVYNYRSEGRRFDNAPGKAGRCLIPLDGFYEFTDVAPLALPLGDSPAGTRDGHASDSKPAKAGAGGKPAKAGGRKSKWLFTLDDASAGPAWAGVPGERAAPGLFCVAGLWRAGVEIGSRSGGPSTGEAFTMLTCEPGPDIAPYHKRQIVLMPRDRWADWLGGIVPAAELIAPTPAGTLRVVAAR